MLTSVSILATSRNPPDILYLREGTDGYFDAETHSYLLCQEFFLCDALVTSAVWTDRENEHSLRMLFVHNVHSKRIGGVKDESSCC